MSHKTQDPVTRETGQEGPLVEEPMRVTPSLPALAASSRALASAACAAVRLATVLQAVGPQAGNTQVAVTGDTAHTRASPPHLCHSIDEVLGGSSDAMGTQQRDEAVKDDVQGGEQATKSGKMRCSSCPKASATDRGFQRHHLDTHWYSTVFSSSPIHTLRAYGHRELA